MGHLHEFLRVFTHPRVMRHPWTMEAAVDFLSVLQGSPGLEVLAPTGRHAGVLAEVVADVPGLAGNMAHDTHVAVLMREHGVRRISTRDTNFHRFPFVEPIDPLSAEP